MPVYLSVAAVVAALVVGGGLVLDATMASSATYDEVAYLEIAAEWWRTGKAERIARMGSPSTFFKVQQGPVLWAIDRAGFGHMIDDPITHQAVLLPLVRAGSLWIWAVGLLLTASWAGIAHGPGASVFAAWMFALSPNLIAHGSLVTMEAPLLAVTAAVGLLATRFLETGSRGTFVVMAAVCGLAFSFKFTAVLFPPLIGVAWLVELASRGILRFRGGVRVAGAILLFSVLMAFANALVTGYARIPLSERTGHHPSIEGRLGSGWGRIASEIAEWPIPQDWAAFARQVHHQRTGGPSYLLGERRQSGWSYYYLVCLAVKVPLTFWALVVGRTWLGRARRGGTSDRLAVSWILATFVIVALGSSRNYGYRYVLFLAPLAIVWISALANWGRIGRGIALIGLVGQTIAVASIHPHELSYFHALCGGPEGGKRILADSNLDWGQGAKSVARLQDVQPAFRDLTWYYFGDTDPAFYGAVGTRFVIDAHGPRRKLPPAPEDVDTRYLAISRSLQYGPWGPAGYFDRFRAVSPVWISHDYTVAIFRAADVPSSR